MWRDCALAIVSDIVFAFGRFAAGAEPQITHRVSVTLLRLTVSDSNCYYTVWLLNSALGKKKETSGF